MFGWHGLLASHVFFPTPAWVQAPTLQSCRVAWRHRRSRHDESYTCFCKQKHGTRQFPMMSGGPLGKRSIHNFYAIPFSKPPNIHSPSCIYLSWLKASLPATAPTRFFTACFCKQKHGTQHTRQRSGGRYSIGLAVAVVLAEFVRLAFVRVGRPGLDP